MAVLAGLAGCAGGAVSREGASSARVTRVIDGDTVEMERLGRVRLIGVDTPERSRCYEAAATRFTRERLEGKVVRYELGQDREDRYGRTLAYLSRGGEMHNLALLGDGYGRALTIAPNDRYESRFERAERGARAAGAGLWERCGRDRVAGPGERVERRSPARGSPRRDGRGGARCLPSSACPGRRDGDGDGCYCE